MTDKVGEWEEAPKEVGGWESVPTKKEPTFGQELKAGGKAAIEEVPGALGAYGGAELGAALGAFGGPFAPLTVPAGAIAGGLGGYFLGQQVKLPESVKQATGFGAEQRAQERKQMPVSSALGQAVPDIASIGFGAVGPGKAVASGVKNVADVLGGKKISEQAGRVSEVAGQVGQKAEKTLTETELAQKQRLEQAQKAEQKAKTAGESALKQMAGVKTLPEAGGFKPIPESASTVGDFIRTQAKNFVDAIKTQRSKAADLNFAASKAEAAEKQALGQYVDTKPLTNQIDNLIKKGGSTDYLNSLTRLRNDLAQTKDFEGLEVLRRKLGDVAFGVPEEGYKAIEQGFARDMYGSLASQMKSYSNNFTKYLDDYKRLSQNLEAYATKIGKGITQTEGAGGKYFAKSGEQVANDVFRSPENYEKFVDAVGGNREIAEAAARRYFAGQLETAKTSKQVEDFFRKNRDILNKVPNVKREIEQRYLGAVKTAEKRAGAAGEVAKAVPTTTVATARKGVQDAMQSLVTAKPGKAIETFENTVLPKIRQAERESGTTLITDEQLAKLRQQVGELEKISDRTAKARAISGLAASYFIGQKVLSGLGTLFGG